MEERECNRCGHKWIKRVSAEPVRCPNCKSQYWNKVRVRAMRKKVDK